MNTVENTITDIINWFSPLEVDFGSVGAIVVFLMKLILLVAIIYGIYEAIKNRKGLWRFVRASAEELRKIEWLNTKDLKQFSVVVIVIITITTFVILGFDQGFLYIRNLLI